MLFFVQMKWNYQGRISQDNLWDLEEKEGEHGLEGIRSGFVQLYKVVSQHRIIAIVRADSLDDLDRNSMGWLPMREYLEFEVVWALRDYESFIQDVRDRFPVPTSDDSTKSQPKTTREVADLWFGSLQRGEFDAALDLIDEDVVWENIAPTPGITDLAPWLGTYHGLQAVKDSFGVWAAHSEMLTFTPYQIMVDGDYSMGLVHEHAKCLANGREYDLYVATHLRIRNGKIVNWRVYWDPSPLVAAYRNMDT